MLPKPARRTHVGDYERGQIETIVAGAERASQLVHDSWRRADDLTPVMVSAIMRDLMIEVGVVKMAANNLADAFLDRGALQAMAVQS